jgi:uncharacterized damage-inducible protein DinB
MALRDAILTEYDHEIATTRRLLERMPDDALAWKPHSRSMSMGGLATHLSNLPTWADAILNSVRFDLADTPPNRQALTSRAEILEAFDRSTHDARTWLAKTDGELEAPWTLARNGRVIFVVPRIAAFRTFVLNHLIHHRGQLSVYLRLNDVPVPPIYGATADEGQGAL